MVATHSTQCLTTQKLAEFAAGDMPVEQIDSIASHVDTCSICQATISSLDEPLDAFVRDLRELPADGLDEESACQAVVQQLVDRHTIPPRPATPAVKVPSSIGGYRVLEPVGTGGMGIVYKAQHPKLKRLVAIKLLPVQRWAGPAAVARFEREMEVSGGLDHPNIVRASDAGDEEGMHYLVMDFVDGLDLSRLVRHMGPLPVPDACEIIRQAASGLAHVHSSGLVHRDIKPSNVMVNKDGRVKILDLGLAMLGEQYLEGENNLTTIGQLMGTLDYMAPEQAADSHQVDMRADVYSLGATLFHLLTGQAPYGGARYNSLLKKVVALANAPVPSPTALREELPAELSDVVSKCLAKDPEQRFASVEEVARSLAPFAATASLARLMEAAAAKPEPDPFRHSAWSMAAVLGPHKESKDGIKKTEASGGGKRVGALGQLLGAAAAFAFIVLAVLVIRVATDRGELIIRSADPDARILVKREDGTAVEELTLEQGNGKITIRSGHYTVELLSDADRMMIDKHQFIIARGDRVILTVQERPTQTAMGSDMSAGGGDYDSGAGMGFGEEYGGSGEYGQEMGSGMGSDYGEEGGYGDDMGSGLGGYGGYEHSSPQEALQARLVYDDKSYNDWMKILKTERNPERLLDAVKAISVLASEGGSEEAAAALLGVMRAYSTTAVNTGELPGGKLGEQILHSLLSMEPNAVAKSVMQEVSQGNTNSRLFIQLLVSALYENSGSTRDPVGRLSTAMAQTVPEMMPELLKMCESSDLNLSRWAVTFAGVLAVSLQLDIQEFEGLESAFQNALRSEDDDTALQVAMSLSRVAPETEGLAEALLRLVDQPAHQNSALAAIGLLGSRAKIALPKLLELLAKETAMLSDDAMPGFGMGGEMSEYDGGSGSMMGGGYGDLSGDGYGMGTPELRALNALEKFGPAAAEAIPMLRKLAEQPGIYQQQAQRVLRKIDPKRGDPLHKTGPIPNANDPFGDG